MNYLIPVICTLKMIKRINYFKYILPQYILRIDFMNSAGVSTLQFMNYLYPRVAINEAQDIYRG